jgi:Regulator of chromosome condensation (RCC1) repeat
VVGDPVPLLVGAPSGRHEPGTVLGRRPGQGQATPVAGVAGIAAGYAGMTAWLGDGTVRTWFFDANARVETVAGLDGVTQVSSSGYHTCAVRRDQSVRCWGDNGSGQMGDAERGTGGEQQVPAPVRW